MPYKMTKAQFPNVNLDYKDPPSYKLKSSGNEQARKGFRQKSQEELDAENEQLCKHRKFLEDQEMLLRKKEILLDDREMNLNKREVILNERENLLGLREKIISQRSFSSAVDRFSEGNNTGEEVQAYNESKQMTAAAVIVDEAGDTPETVPVHEEKAPVLLPSHKFSEEIVHDALIRATRKGNLGKLRALLNAKDISVEHRSKTGKTMLMLAAENGHLTIVDYLVKDAGADVEATIEYQKYNALHLAAKKGHVPIVQYLIEDAGIHVSSVSASGETALHLAAAEGQVDAMRFLLLKGKAEVDVKREDGVTPLQVAAENGHLEVVRILIEEGRAIVDRKDNTLQQTALHKAAQKGHIHVVRYLVWNAKADTTYALHFAAYGNHFDVVSYLVNYGNVKANEIDCNGFTADHYTTSSVIKKFLT